MASLSQLDAKPVLPCSSECSNSAKQALFSLNRAQSAFTYVPELNYSFLPGCYQLSYVLGSARIHKVIQKYPLLDFSSLIITMQCLFRVILNRANQRVITWIERLQQLPCAHCWYEEVRTATTKGTQTFQLGILDDGNMPGPMV